MKNTNYREYKDMFNYYKIITKINPFYKLCFDNKAKNFVVINTEINDEVCLRFSNFSINVELELQKSQIKNANKIFDMVEQHNIFVQEKHKKNLADNLYIKLNELLSYSKRTNHISDSDIKKIIEVKNA